MSASGCYRVVFLVFNLLFQIIGVTALSLIIWILGTSDVENKVDIGKLTITYSVLAASFFLVLIGSVGFVGGCVESTCLLKLYITLHTLLLVLEIVIATSVTSAVQQNIVAEPGAVAWQELGSTQRDSIQRQLQCCGYSNATEEFWDSSLPSSCRNTTAGVVISRAAIQVWQWTCKERIGQWFTSNIPTWASVIALVVLIQLTSGMLSCCVLNRVEKARRVEPEKSDSSPSSAKPKMPASVYLPTKPIPPFDPRVPRRNPAVLTDPRVRARLANVDF